MKNDIVIAGTGTSYNPKNPGRNKFVSDDCTVIFIRKSSTGTVIAAQTYGDFDSTVDTYDVPVYFNLVQDQTGRSMGNGVVVGFQSGDRSDGFIPTKSVPFSVFK